MKKIILSLALCAGASNVTAGLDWMTVHSRANCLNNESITWWYLHPHNWRVVSFHRHAGTRHQHSIDSGYAINWRQHAIHWGEPMASGRWEVWGYHYQAGAHERTPMAVTQAVACNIIEGW